MTTVADIKNLRQHNIIFALIAEQILAFAEHSNIVREVKTLSPNFKQIV